MGDAPKIASPKFTGLAEKLKSHIAEQGPIGIDSFMAACLTDSEFGYYINRDPLGTKGDFITAPEISQVFGELIGLWCVVVWQQMGQPERLQLVELGPGRGTLMRDALRAGAIAPGFLDAVEVVFVEASPVLRKIQADRFSQLNRPVSWVASPAALGQVPDAAGAIVIANEFFDALPIRQYVRHAGQWRERLVGLDEDDQLAPRLGGEEVPPLELPVYAEKISADDTVIETCPAAAKTLETLSLFAAEHPFALLMIDYGPVQSGPGDSLQAVSAHKFADIFAAPGEADLTAHVDFQTLAHHARNLGIAPFGPITQGSFLMALGLQPRVQQLMSGLPEAQAEAVAAAATRLIDPAQMGGLFKVLCLAKGFNAPPPPFDMLAGNMLAGTGEN